MTAGVSVRSRAADSEHENCDWQSAEYEGYDRELVSDGESVNESEFEANGEHSSGAVCVCVLLPWRTCG